MRVIVETPKWSFTKYRTVDGRCEREFLSPLPTLFNYGYVPGTKVADGMEQDVIILGLRMRQGPAEVQECGRVHIVDDGLRDDKIIASVNGRAGWLDGIQIRFFFIVYMPFKRIQYLLKERRIADCRFLGFTLSHRR